MLLNLSAGDTNARAAFDGAVTALLEARSAAPRLTVMLAGDSLAAETVAMLVGGLRRLRDAGGALAVEPASAAVRDGLALYGLDRVFAFPLEPEPAPRSCGRPWVRRMAAASIVLVALLTAGAARPARAQSDVAPHPDAAAVIERVVARNPELASYQGRLHVDLRMVSFPFLREHLDATTYYKRPSNYEVVFDKLPSYAKGFEHLYTDIGDPSNWSKRFVITTAGESDFEHHRDLALRLVLRNRGMIDHETVLVDPATWTIDEIRYDYDNGGSITMSQHFETVGPYSLLVSQRAVIAIPHVRAVAYGSYSDYQTNVAVDDAVFAKN